MCRIGWDAFRAARAAHCPMLRDMETAREKQHLLQGFSKDAPPDQTVGSKIMSLRSLVDSRETAMAGLIGQLSIHSLSSVSDFCQHRAAVWSNTFCWPIQGSKLDLVLHTRPLLYQCPRIPPLSMARNGHLSKPPLNGGPLGRLLLQPGPYSEGRRRV